ncbi:hypothetical protein ACFOVU_18620 [Nocardiopsis sediminis]|uniref:Uncharacterized protein n=1 Tax=Nocardiopsis sediminis TaxID=1778267 RepID=A0ABV8FPE9_9ACTN
MFKPAEAATPGEVMRVNGNPYPITAVRASFDAVWIDIDTGLLDLPVRFDYGHTIDVDAAA